MAMATCQDDASPLVSQQPAHSATPDAVRINRSSAEFQCCALHTFTAVPLWFSQHVPGQVLHLHARDLKAQQCHTAESLLSDSATL